MDYMTCVTVDRRLTVENIALRVSGRVEACVALAARHVDGLGHVRGRQLGVNLLEVDKVVVQEYVILRKEAIEFLHVLLCVVRRWCDVEPRDVLRHVLASPAVVSRHCSHLRVGGRCRWSVDWTSEGKMWCSMVGRFFVSRGGGGCGSTRSQTLYGMSWAPSRFQTGVGCFPAGAVVLSVGRQRGDVVEREGRLAG